MRISNGMIYKNINTSLQKNMYQLAKVQQQITSGIKIHRPSDDPVSLSRILDVNEHRSRTERYMNSIDLQTERLERAEVALTQATEILRRAKDIAIEGSNGYLAKLDARAFAQEVDILIDGMISAASRSQGRVDFKALFKRDTSGEPETIDYIGEKVNLHSNSSEHIFDAELLNDTLDPEEVFLKSDEGLNVFDTLIKLRDGFRFVAENGGYTTTIQETLGDLDKNIDRLLSKRTELGAKANRLQTLRVQLEDQSFNLEKSFAELQGVDIAEVSIKLNEYELTYHAALSATARIMQTGLVDYLR